MPEKCPRCGSEKMMDGVHLNAGRDPGFPPGSPRQRIEAYVHKDPDAWMFKGPVFSILQARVCGGCGHTEIYTTNFEQLYDAYQQSHGG